MSKQAILILDGEINLDYLSAELINRKADLVCCADGAYLYIAPFLELRKKVNVIIGDFDSIGDTSQIDAQVKIIRDLDQDSTDFDKALAYLIENGVSQVIVYGAGGLSSDHFLGNLSTAMFWKDKIKIEFYDRYGSFYFIGKETVLRGVKGHKISIIPFCQADDIYYEGLKYPLNGERLVFGQRIGTRNIAIADTVNIRYGSGQLLVYIENQNYIKERLN